MYFAAGFIRFNAGPYVIPFVPFIGIFFGWAIIEVVRLVKKRELLVTTLDWAPSVVLVLLLGIAAYRGIANRFESILTLQDQDKRFEPISSMLGASDTIYVHGTTEILVLLNKPNLNPYISIEAGKDDYVAAQRYGGSFAALVDEIEASAPKIVALSRLQRVGHGDALRGLVEQNYDQLDWPGYDVYVRKQ